MKEAGGEDTRSLLDFTDNFLYPVSLCRQTDGRIGSQAPLSRRMLATHSLHPHTKPVHPTQHDRVLKGSPFQGGNSASHIMKNTLAWEGLTVRKCILNPNDEIPKIHEYKCYHYEKSGINLHAESKLHTNV